MGSISSAIGDALGDVFGGNFAGKFLGNSLVGDPLDIGKAVTDNARGITDALLKSGFNLDAVRKNVKDAKTESFTDWMDDFGLLKKPKVPDTLNATFDSSTDTEVKQLARRNRMKRQGMAGVAGATLLSDDDSNRLSGATLLGE